MHYCSFDPRKYGMWQSIYDHLALLNILKYNWKLTPLGCVVSLFNVSCNTNITKTHIRNHIQYIYRKDGKHSKCSYWWNFVFNHYNTHYKKINKFLTFKCSIPIQSLILMSHKKGKGKTSIKHFMMIMFLIY